jgi:hypothetical protein
MITGGKRRRMTMFRTPKFRYLAAALVLAGACASAPASAQSDRRGVYETPPNDPLYHRPRGNDQNTGYGMGSSYDPNQGYGQNQGYGRPQNYEDRRAYNGQPGFGYHQPYRPPAGYGPVPYHGGTNGSQNAPVYYGRPVK